MAPGGEARWVPRKNVYAFNLGKDLFETLSTDYLRYAGSIGHDGTPVAREPGVTFCEYRLPGR